MEGWLVFNFGLWHRERLHGSRGSTSHIPYPQEELHERSDYYVVGDLPPCEMLSRSHHAASFVNIIHLFSLWRQLPSPEVHGNK